MSKYTVGKINSALIIRDETGARIAQVSSGRGLPTQEEEKRASLFAAAPVMLHALTVALETLENEYAECLQDDYPAFKLIREAIALADGVPPAGSAVRSDGEV